MKAFILLVQDHNPYEMRNYGVVLGLSRETIAKKLGGKIIPSNPNWIKISVKNLKESPNPQVAALAGYADLGGEVTMALEELLILTL